MLIDESRVSLFSKCLSARSVIFANGTVYPLTPTLSPKDLQEVEVFGGEGETRGDLDPGRRAEFLLRTLPWANVCCPFRALEGSSGVLPLLIQKNVQSPGADNPVCPTSRVNRVSWKRDETKPGPSIEGRFFI